MIRYRQARPSDREPIERLLTDVRLPVVSLAAHLHGFEIAEEGDRIVGSAGLERYGHSGLLRSVGVAPAFRGRGVGRALVDRVVEHAAAAGVRDLYLLTTTASDYFSRLGFVPIGRSQVAPAVQASEEFVEASCEEAQAMRMQIGGRVGVDPGIGQKTRGER